VLLGLILEEEIVQAHGILVSRAVPGNARDDHRPGNTSLVALSTERAYFRPGIIAAGAYFDDDPAARKRVSFPARFQRTQRTRDFDLDAGR